MDGNAVSRYGVMNTYVQATTIDSAALDEYSRRGVAISRDAAHCVAAALRRDAFDMRQRGGNANIKAAEINEQIAKNMVEAMR